MLPFKSGSRNFSRQIERGFDANIGFILVCGRNHGWASLAGPALHGNLPSACRSSAGEAGSSPCSRTIRTVSSIIARGSRSGRPQKRRAALEPPFRFACRWLVEFV